jgi:hypothetical protein
MGEADQMDESRQGDPEADQNTTSQCIIAVTEDGIDVKVEKVFFFVYVNR